MRPADLVRLTVLAALWGGSFMLLRVVAPTLGAVVTAEARVVLASIALVGWCLAKRVRLDLREHARSMTVVGLFNSAIPFALFAFAVRYLPAGYAAILNATSPLFGAVIARAWLGEALGTRRLVGIGFGIAGVSLLVRLGPVALTGETLLACAACLGAALCYGFAGNYSKRLAGDIPPTAMATGSQITAAIALLPLLPLDPIRATPTAHVLVATVVLAIASTAVAYLLYFRLIRDIGATRALTVTFLVPLFALALGWAVLDEPVTARMAVGVSLVLVATWLVVSASGGTASSNDRRGPTGKASA